ncbi:MAG TPA: phospholipase D-like domain-containing protein [Nocardioides sp.]|nr:phospholipase D-like domain-containing protein [Nocardioides sp.]
MRKYVVMGVLSAVLASPVMVAPVAAGQVAAVADGHDGHRSGDGTAKADGFDGRTAHDGRKGHDGRQSTFHVADGVLFNTPFTNRWRILSKQLREIRHTFKGAKIRIMSWNFMNRDITDALINAHQRGVSVRIFMARTLVNPEFRRLGNALRVGNANRPRAMRSWARTCSNSCRGKGGAMHAKWMTISEAGSTKWVVGEGSANLTTAAAVNQWNDWLTTTNNREIYRGFQKVFRQASHDHKYPAYQFRSGNTLTWFAPRPGRKDLVMDMLDKVRCKGARNAGINGRTAIRIASAVIQNSRGQRIAHKIKDLQNRGCNIRMVYTLSSNEVLGILQGVPVRHLAYDTDGDGAFDNYLHMKAMSISGNYDGDRSARIIFNGSANWSTIGVISDEQGMIVRDDSLERQYGKWITGLYNHAPAGRLTTPQYYRSRGLPNPYKGLELELR